jgi:hypothetical protein
MSVWRRYWHDFLGWLVCLALFFIAVNATAVGRELATNRLALAKASAEAYFSKDWFAVDLFIAAFLSFLFAGVTQIMPHRRRWPMFVCIGAVTILAGVIYVLVNS